MNPLSVDLPNHRTHRLSGPAHLCVESGLVWITIDGRPEDLLLAAGQGMRFARGEAVVAYALGGAARFQVAPVAAAAARGLPAWAGKAAAWLRGAPLHRRHA
ncbi:MAG: DUF2917 domain-containing protein [Rubrivivax sp.]|nr:DUF2917 domain-containing protein [Rubrivivax sp.]